ncbi:MAG: hypothetical protein COA62_05585 [Rhodobiaceae bacterium]|nr:MAG: hypothetical protein COA62_05585 [Rhodobiaceae bacterium]
MTHNDGNHGDGNHGDGSDTTHDRKSDGDESMRLDAADDSAAPADTALHYLHRTPPPPLPPLDSAGETELETLKHMNPVLTALYIAKVFGTHAGEEALMRALICERQHHHTSARFWMGIYERLVD